jgi:hypothetical protein
MRIYHEGRVLENRSLAAVSLATAGRADLTDAYVSEEQLNSAESLEGATMPNGQKYEDWLKSKGDGEDGENDDSS